MVTRFLHLKSSSIYFFDLELLIELMASSIYCSRLVVDQSLAPDQMSSKVHFLFLSCGVKRHRRDFPRSNFSVSQSHQTQVHFYRLSALRLLLPKTTSCLTFAFFSYQKDAFILYSIRYQNRGRGSRSFGRLSFTVSLSPFVPSLI